ncbi:hypothetical protein, partial [Pseudomonas aeruginosa]
SGNAIERIDGINWWNLDKRLLLEDKHNVRWEYLTTGGFGGIELWLDQASGGELRLNTGPVQMVLPIDE